MTTDTEVALPLAGSFYITTPIYYVNDRPHIGHAYTTIIADVLRRYRVLFGQPTYFLTGTDEHGQKVAEAARARGLEPQAHVDGMVENFIHAWKELEIDYDIFMRTTFPFHREVVAIALQQLYDKGEIYRRDYEGWYSVSEEIFYPDKDIVDGKSPAGKAVTRITETNYFFRMSSYQERLISYIEANPGFIFPESRRNEVLGFLRQPLADLCISRPKARVSWGIPLPFDLEFVTYVWFDALLNYTSAVGYLQDTRAADFSRLWQGVVHLIGKDILITHAVYWPTMLMALGVPLPERIVAHGWWLTAPGAKMSKSEGRVVSPLDMKDVVGVDPLRYFLVRAMRLGHDAMFSEAEVITRVNADLANNLGNLFSRVVGLLVKYFDGLVPAAEASAPESKILSDLTEETVASAIKHVVEFAPDLGIEAVMTLLNRTNQYVSDRAPWKMAKEDLKHAAETLRCALEVVRISGILLSPVMPTKMAELAERLTGSRSVAKSSDLAWGQLVTGASVGIGPVLFPKIEIEQETE